ncbi:MAG: GMC family oxidoreductase [Solirubrobacterales bacterium]|nr:GMC family oxidoreductase [Solirubrobacterales bacterium]
MSRVSRRKFLSGAASAAAGAAALPNVAQAMKNHAAAARQRTPLTRSQERAVIIGSGFGGGVSSLRLAQAGVDVLVLERGRWWPTGPNAETFPHSATPDRRDLFYTVWPELGGNPLGLPVGMPPYVGLLEPVVGDGIVAIVPAGVGGGSLVYQGMTLQPTEEVFSSWYPSSINYAEMDSVYYPRVAQMLSIDTAPEQLINSKTYYPPRQFAANVQSAGYGLSKIPMPIDWNYALAELKGEMNPAYTNGECTFGVNNGGKHTVDVTYIAQGQATGRVRVATHHNVTEIAQDQSGGWEVQVNVTDDSGNVLEQKLITTKALFVNAGTVNTSRLLVAAAAKGTIKDLPDKLGQGYGTNGDQIYVWTDLAQDFGAPQGGPVVYGSFEWNDSSQPANTVIQASLPPIGLNTNGWQPLPPAILPGASHLPIDTGALDIRSTMLGGYGVSSGRGKFTYNASSGKVDLSFPSGGDAALAARIKQRIDTVAGKGSLALNTNDMVNTTWHSLGGACIGDVTDTEGRVQGQQGLYVLDGALQPGTTCACNPSMTIAAVAERAMDRIVAKDVGTVI